ncbi:MAG TPA: hypothetical protein VHM90_02905 [Phycisphaerae bacterium]|nr:hypothetical protein [Phycisphaerae bacterium]
MLSMLAVIAGFGLLACLMLGAFTTQTLVERGAGEAGHEVHMVAFVTTGATVEVATKFKVITGFAFGHQGSPGTTEILSLDETCTDYGQINVPAGGFVTVRRAATTTSGLVFSLILFGY